MAWTKEQDEAIHKRGENIIVSAGAGSGKTAVLSERILDYCKNGGDIRRVLVLTFTEAAAAEMKERIRKKLMENGLSTQAELIDSAYITTFDSYSLSIVRKYYYRLGLKSGVAIMDGALIQVKLREKIRELFTEYYTERNESFYSFLKKYSLQSDDKILEMVFAMSNRLDLIVDIDSFVRTYEATYFTPLKLEEITDAYVRVCRSEVQKFRDSLNTLVEACDRDISSGAMRDFADGIRNHLAGELSYEDMSDVIANLKFPVVSRKATGEVKDAKTAANDILKDIQKKLFGKYGSVEEMKDEILSTKEDVSFLLEMCMAARRKLMDYKMEQNMFGFSDIAKFAIQLVKEDEDVRKELSGSYDEILVDEYQDTSDIQEAFLSLIEHDNRYMVGDIKQSIYRFRNANPYIFKKKYDDYSRHNGGHKIDLTYNFRSRSEVLDNINALFNVLMTDEVGDADYVSDHQMHYGQKLYESLTQPVDYNMEVLSYAQDEDSDFSQAETEAFIIGKEILKIKNSGTKVLHDKAFEPVTYNDFAILISTATDFVTFKEVFEYLNIPLSIEASLDLKDSILPVLYANILKAVALERKKDYSTEYYHAIASLGRSFIYEYTDQQIYDAVVNKAPVSVEDDIRKLAETDELSYFEFFYKIDEVMGIYSSLPKIGNVDSNLVVLEQIRKTFSMLDSVGYSLMEASEYMAELLSSGIKMEYKPTSSPKDSVRIMTIHKSKGLEFAYCFFPILTRGFNQADMRATAGLSDRYGIFIPAADEGTTQTIIRAVNAEEIRRADISEKVRLFYVALTRAREKMFLILPDREIQEMDPGSYRSFADMVEQTKVLLQYRKSIDLKDYDITDYHEAAKKATFGGTEELSYDSTPMPERESKEHISKRLKSIPDKAKEEAIELGLKFHSSLESLDLANPDIDSLPVDDFMKSTLRGILSHPVFKNIKDAKAYHEHEFYFSAGGKTYHGIIDLFLDYPDHIDIIDYKLSATDSPEYIRQLSIYRQYIETKSSKPVSLYLLSILKQEIKKIEA